jgi:hypothetical protein
MIRVSAALLAVLCAVPALGSIYGTYSSYVTLSGSDELTSAHNVTFVNSFVY